MVKGDDGTLFLTILELADRWGVSRETIRRRILTGNIPAFDAGSGTERAQWRVPLADVERIEHGGTTE